MTKMPDARDDLSPLPGSTPSEMFPVLTSAQQARVLAHGQRRTVEQSEIVVELNEHVNKFFVVVSGQLHALQVANNQEHAVAICNPGMFTGELTVLSGRRGLDHRYSTLLTISKRLSRRLRGEANRAGC